MAKEVCCFLMATNMKAGLRMANTMAKARFFAKSKEPQKGLWADGKFVLAD